MQPSVANRALPPPSTGNAAPAPISVPAIPDGAGLAPGVIAGIVAGCLGVLLVAAIVVAVVRRNNSARVAPEPGSLDSATSIVPSGPSTRNTAGAGPSSRNVVRAAASRRQLRTSNSDDLGPDDLSDPREARRMRAAASSSQRSVSGSPEGKPAAAKRSPSKRKQGRSSRRVGFEEQSGSAGASSEVRSASKLRSVKSTRHMKAGGSSRGVASASPKMRKVASAPRMAWVAAADREPGSVRDLPLDMTDF
jgi:hypothetical protein